MYEINPTPKRVVIYARVSTEHEAQINALENQLDWYKPILEMHKEWQVVNWYVDKCSVLPFLSTMHPSTLKTESPKALLMPMWRKSLFLKTILNGICDSAGMTR